MSPPPPPLVPDQGEQGVLSADRVTAGARALRSWDLLLEMAEASDLGATARHKGRTGREVLLPLGSWPQTRTLDDILSDAHSGRTVPDIDLDELERQVVLAQSDASDAAVVAAVRRSRDALAGYLGTTTSDAADGLLTASPLGPLPVLTFLHATAYQLALSALDLAPCGARAPAELLEAGVVALVDTTGALAFRHGVSGSICAVLPETVWGFGSTAEGWRVRELAAAEGPAVQATAQIIIDVSAGRALNVAAMWADGRLVTRDLPGLLRMAPVVEHVPGIPGGAALRAASKYLGGVSRLLGRLPWPG
jgi:hypothetical protein